MNAKSLPVSAAIRFGAGLAALAAVSCISACAGGPSGPLPLTPTQQYAAVVSQAPEQIALAVHPRGLSPNQQSALTDFFSRWRDNGGGDVQIKTPITQGGPSVARLTADATISFLHHLGVPGERLRLVGYDDPRPNAPVIASFMRYEAIAPQCGDWGNITSTGSNRPYQNFGCAVTADIAEMVANPRDLVTPAAVDPADNSRREVVLDKYRQGTTTSTTADSQASGTVSQSQ